MKKVTKIIGRAGTGKTTYLINEVRKLLEDGVSPRDITMITFSVRAAAVFVERACAISEEYEKKHFKNFRTMHSMSSRLIGWEPDCAFTSKDWDIFYRRYYPELGSIDASQGIDTDTYYLTHGDKEKLKESSRFSAMESIDGLMRNLMIEHNDFNEMYMQTGRDMSYTQHYITRHYWDEKRDKYRINFDSIQGNIDPMDQIEFSKNFSEFKEMEGLMDFTDVIEKCLTIGVAPDTKYLFVDEFQDFTGLHYALYKLWRDSAEYVWICGDDAQCFVEGTLINTPLGMKPIEDIVIGDDVLTFAGNFLITSSTVIDTLKKHVSGDVLTIKTKSGKCIKVTPNHHIFVYPHSYADGESVNTYVYLMYLRRFGYRIGITNNLKSRLHSERADTILAIKRCDSVTEALYYENLYSLQYGIPKVVFESRRYTKQQRYEEMEWIKKLFGSIPTIENATRLCEDLGIDLRYPHLYTQGTNREKGPRVVINLQLYYRKYSDSAKNERMRSDTTKRGKVSNVRNIITVETSDEETINKLLGDGYKLTNAKNGKRLRISSADDKVIMRECRKLKYLLQCPVRTFTHMGRHPSELDDSVTRSRPSVLIPASNALEGMYLSVFDGDELLLDEITSVEREHGMYTVYDLTIDKTHNYFADSICVHNTVQRWAGANARYFIDEPCDERIVLPQTYRHGKVIFDNAQMFLDRVTEIEICDVLPHPDIDGEVIKVYGDGWKSYLDFADDESVLVLAATKKWCGAIKNKLEQLAPNILWTWLGTDAIVERVVRQYNVIADLERGLEVDWDRIEELFTSSNPLPTQMTFSERESTLEGIKTVQYEKKPMLMRIKHDITIGEFKNRDFYTKSSFGKDLLVRRWNGRALMSNIKDIEYFPQAHDHFPKEWNTDVLPESKKRIGTIHKSKGDEADTVVLFMSVPYPVLGGIGVDEVCDDLLRQFYVGATRPKYKLIEVYSYLSYQNGDSAPDPLSIVR